MLVCGSTDVEMKIDNSSLLCNDKAPPFGAILVSPSAGTLLTAVPATPPVGTLPVGLLVDTLIDVEHVAPPIGASLVGLLVATLLAIASDVPPVGASLVGSPVEVSVAVAHAAPCPPRATNDPTNQPTDKVFPGKFLRSKNMPEKTMDADTGDYGKSKGNAWKLL